MEDKSTLKRKHVEIQEVERKGLFQEGSYPAHYYPIGDNFFVLASVNNNNKKAGIHIREFKRYGDNYYSSVNGITLRPEQLSICFTRMPPTSIFDVADINLQLEALNPDNKREFYILMTDDGQFSLTHEHTCRSGRVYKFPLDISFKQWAAIYKVLDDVISSYIDLKFSSIDLLETFKMVSKRSLPVEKPIHINYEEAERDMNICLTTALYRSICEKKGLIPPVRVNDEEDIIEIGDLVAVRDFNDSCMFLNIVGVVLNFEKELSENMLYQDRVPLIEYVSEQYLKVIRLDKCIAAARKDFCTYEF